MAESRIRARAALRKLPGFRDSGFKNISGRTGDFAPLDRDLCGIGAIGRNCWFVQRRDVAAFVVERLDFLGGERAVVNADVVGCDDAAVIIGALSAISTCERNEKP